MAAVFEKGARLTAQVGAACGGGLCRKVVFADAQGAKVKVLKIDRPLAPKVLRFASGLCPLRVTGATSIDHL